MATNREDAIYFARLSEQGERYEDMIKYMKQVAAVSKISNSDHNLLNFYIQSYIEFIFFILVRSRTIK